MRPTLILDSSVWIDAVDDPSFLQRTRRAKCAIAIADEAVLELIAGAVSAAEHRDARNFERRRRVCAIAAGCSTKPLPPIGIHYARLVGYRTPGTWDVRSALHDVARTRDLESFVQLLSTQGRHGSGFADWPKSRDERRRHWMQSIRGAISASAPHLLGERRPMISDAEYNQLRKPDANADSRLIRIEVEELKSAVHSLRGAVRMDTAALIERLRPHIQAYLQIFKEAYLDLYTGSHNACQRRVKFELNDWSDLSQLRYLQANWRWVTHDGVWRELARRTEFGESVVLPSEVDT